MHALAAEIVEEFGAPVCAPAFDMEREGSVEAEDVSSVADGVDFGASGCEICVWGSMGIANGEYPGWLGGEEEEREGAA